MPKRISVLPHHELGELETRYRQAKGSVERSQYQIVWLLRSGKTTEEVSEVTGYSLRWIRVIAKRYNELGEEGIGDRRHQNRGTEPLLDEVQQAQLLQAMATPRSDRGIWNGPRVARWMSQVLERAIYPQRGWEFLKRWEHRLRVPRPEHYCSDAIEQQEWKKNSN
ncbi:winged helix-turn-helix domain-containing protein [Scytonema sp. PCC 10023]|uniref:winged helix-turn-helix domain-containing protein n=1 Tax=Scytonema sp. PCC 10023 TaxID=1680591 RepID=UPI0039C6BDAE